MKLAKKQPNTVAGIAAPSVRPTPLGAALIAMAITFPVTATLLLVDLLLL